MPRIMEGKSRQRIFSSEKNRDRFKDSEIVIPRQFHTEAELLSIISDGRTHAASSTTSNRQFHTTHREAYTTSHKQLHTTGSHVYTTDHSYSDTTDRTVHTTDRGYNDTTDRTAYTTARTAHTTDHIYNDTTDRLSAFLPRAFYSKKNAAGKQRVADNEVIKPSHPSRLSEPAREDARLDSSRGESVFYHIKLLSQEFHLRLEHSPGFLHKNFKIHRRKGEVGGKSRTLTETFDRRCFYRGRSLLHADSSVALSVCDGLHGAIIINDSIYLIEPLGGGRHHDLVPGEHPPHVIYKHSTPGVKLRGSGVNSRGSGVKLRWSGTETQDHHNLQNLPTINSGCGVSSQNTVLSMNNLSSTSMETPLPHVTRLRRSTRNSRHSKRHDVKRLSRRRNIETIVVVDKKMLKSHGEQNVTTYVLTILNMVSNLFHDNTIGSKINITLVALILLEGDEPGLEVSHQADESLTNFCQWQSTLEGTHHDHAILLTGVDICSYKDSPCDTLGFAPIEGMCKRYRSCTINEDTGLGTAFTIAHEIGHNFGMFHDGEGNYCKDYAGSIMAPTLLGHDGMFKWSACSRKYLNQFLRSSQAWCLSDEPKMVAELSFPDKLPGELYNADIQCKWQFGPRARLCMFDFARDLCKSLWCFTGGTKCETKFLPAAEGTSCGPSQWCRKGVCVKYGDSGPPPISGGWGPYSSWSPCTRSCGGGVTHKERICSHPRAQYGGQDCEGESRVYKICNMQKCANPVKSFRTIQCESYNSKPFRGWFYTWTPYTTILEEADICRLYCKAESYDFYFALSEKVVDGTPCRSGSDKVCVEGVCMPVGCDHIIDSDAELDICGVCRGDNSTCEIIDGIFNKTLPPNAYHEILRLPRGARSISVREQTQSPSYLSVRTPGGRYHITGGWRVSWPGEYKIAESTFTYTRPYNGPESLQSQGPLSDDVIVEVLVLQGPSPRIEYQYSLPKRIDVIIPSRDNYTWSIATSECSHACARGKKTISARCLKNLYEEVGEEKCEKEEKPETGVFPCNTQPCQPRWVAEEWSSCSQSCGGGRQRRRLSCLQKISGEEDERVRSRRCQHLPKPNRRRHCNEQECPPQWHTGHWSKCSETCGEGAETRALTCRSRHKHGYQDLPRAMCEHLTAPPTAQPCNLESCDYVLQWFLSSWSKCSKSCGPGVRQRTFQCTGRKGFGRYATLPDVNCSHLETPDVPVRELCRLPPCTARWFVSPWSQCTKTCGKGVKSRLVRCIDETSGRSSDTCSDNNKPTTESLCVRKTCVSQQPGCEDEFGWCALIPVHNLCSHQFYGSRCCHSCKTRAV